jgi:hypothetical protein
MPVPRAILSPKLSPPPLPVWVGEEDGDEGDEEEESLTDPEFEMLENPISVVVGAVPTDEVGDTELLGVSVGVPVARSTWEEGRVGRKFGDNCRLL